jgi:rhomboid family GlyGly-CTERM serine protease
MVTAAPARLTRMLADLNCDGRHGVALLCICAGLIGIQLLAGRSQLAYGRAPLAQGELWRLLTAHLVHLDLSHAVLNSLGLVLSHAVLNSLGLVLMWALFVRDYSPRQWLFILAGVVAAIDAGLWFRSSTVAWYVGSSGALHGVMAAGTCARIVRREADGWLLAVILAVKLAYEQSAGALPFSGSEPVVVDAHLYGVVGGLAAALAMKPAQRA